MVLPLLYHAGIPFSSPSFVETAAFRDKFKIDKNYLKEKISQVR